LTVNPVELVHRPETLRLRGELRIRLGENEVAESDYAEAISLSRRIGAKMWTLRAATSLARAQQARGDIAAAREVLGSIYASFTEGFGTNDLLDAKRLLDDLSVRAA
jgi:predicted ATPase